jgi:hypothetical protein
MLTLFFPGFPPFSRKIGSAAKKMSGKVIPALPRALRLEAIFSRAGA